MNNTPDTTTAAISVPFHNRLRVAALAFIATGRTDNDLLRGAMEAEGFHDPAVNINAAVGSSGGHKFYLDYEKGVPRMIKGTPSGAVAAAMLGVILDGLDTYTTEELEGLKQFCCDTTDVWPEPRSKEDTFRILESAGMTDPAERQRQWDHRPPELEGRFNELVLRVSVAILLRRRRSPEDAS